MDVPIFHPSYLDLFLLRKERPYSKRLAPFDKSIKYTILLECEGPEVGRSTESLYDYALCIQKVPECHRGDVAQTLLCLNAALSAPEKCSK